MEYPQEQVQDYRLNLDWKTADFLMKYKKKLRHMFI